MRGLLLASIYVNIFAAFMWAVGLVAWIMAGNPLMMIASLLMVIVTAVQAYINFMRLRHG